MRLASLFRRDGTERDDQSSPWFARLSSPIIFLILTMAAAGCYLAFNIPVSVFPTTDFPRIVIAVENGVMPIDQMLVTVTRPIEEAVNSVEGLEQVRSITSRGSAEIDLFFDWKSDMFQTLQRVDSALARAQSILPSTVAIETHRLTFASFPIMGYSLTSQTMPPTQLWEMATYDMKPRLNRLTGVATVVVQGGQEPEFHVILDSAKLLSTTVTVTDILDSIRRANLVSSPGLLPQGRELYLTLVNGQVRTPEGIGEIVVKTTPAGIPVRIRDVALVEQGVKPVYTLVTANGKPAILLNISRQPNSNTIQVATEVHREIARIQQRLPPGITLTPFYDQSQVVSDSISSVRDAIILGMILASIIMVLFLRDFGTSIVAGLVIPVSILITLIVLKLLGQSFNLMTLGGLAAAVGLVIDDAIVVVENIVLHGAAGQPRLLAIQSALSEITAPLIGSTITPIVVFLPLISIAGVTGTFFRALAVTVTASLLTSLVLALTWTPTLSQYFISSRSAKTQSGDKEIAKEQYLAAEEATLSGAFGGVVRFYERTLAWALQKPKWLAALCLALIACTYLGYRGLGTDLLPEMDEGGFILDYLMPAGTSLQETDRVLQHVEQILRAIPEVESTSRRTGLQLGLAAVTEANSGDFTIKLKAKRSRSVDAVMEEVREKIRTTEPALDIELLQLLQDMIGDLSNAPEPVQIKLFSNDPLLLKEWGTRVGEAIAKVPNVVDVLNGIDNTISGPAVVYQVDPAIAARAGFTAEEVATDATAILEGVPALAAVVNNDRAYNIRIRYPQTNRDSLQALGNTLLNSSAGHTATLASLTTLQDIAGQPEIRRENLQRDITVTARLEGRDLGSGMADVQKAVAGLHLPSSIRVEYGGTYAEQQQSFHDLTLVLVLAVALVFLVLLFEFRTVSAPVAVLASAVLSTCGVVFALLITGTTFNIASFMGLIMVIGIVAKNGILLLDADHKFRGWGLAPREAMIQAGRRRLRPIVMTAMATVAGMLPLAFAWGAGSQMLQPLAIAVIGGVTVSMLLSLVITPVVNYAMTSNQ